MSDVDPWDFSRSQPVTPAAPPPDLNTGFADNLSTFQPNSSFDSLRTDDISTFSAGQVGPPVVWLSAAVVAAVIGLVVAAFSLPGGLLYIVAWAIAGPVAIALLTVFARKDAARQTAVLYSFPSWKPAAYRTAMALTVLAVVADALRIADWVGHR